MIRYKPKNPKALFNKDMLCDPIKLKQSKSSISILIQLKMIHKLDQTIENILKKSQMMLKQE